MKINYTLDEGALAPQRAHKTDAGWDLFCKSDFSGVIPGAAKCSKTDKVEHSLVVDTGVHVAIPEGYVGFIKSRSGLNIKKGIQSEGVIDSGYTGPIKVKLYNHSKEDVEITPGSKITQLVLLPILQIDEMVQVDSLEETDRGDKGFGSSDETTI